MSLHDTETLDGFMVYLVSCLLMTAVIYGFHTWDIRAIRKAMSRAMVADLKFAQQCQQQYRPSIHSVWLASELQWRVKRRKDDILRFPMFLAFITFILNGLASVAEAIL